MFALQLALSGLAQGAIYALVALSLCVVYRSTTVVNFGHGDLVMAGAFVVYVMVVLAGLPFLASAFAAVVLLFILGLCIEVGLIERIKAGPHIGFALMCIGFGYVLRGIARAGWGREVLPMPRVLDFLPLLMGDLVVTGDSLVIFAVVAVLLGAFFLLFYRSSAGRVMQAVCQSERGAGLVGINVRAFHGVMWGAGAALGAAGGVLVAPITLLHPNLGAIFLIKGFAAMTLGGFGSFGGAVAGGLILGVAEQLVGGYVSTKMIDITAYLVIILVLALRPNGLFGRAIAERV
ncbi:MAG TPA: branched-chain amino acid ABC transporter permease [Burkholderiales bacterium]|nr:branched-chain amino acid ABC transporter permease [Burkholderiales bacterium]